jgi:TPR repeat protein
LSPSGRFGGAFYVRLTPAGMQKSEVAVSKPETLSAKLINLKQVRVDRLNRHSVVSIERSRDREERSFRKLEVTSTATQAKPSEHDLDTDASNFVQRLDGSLWHVISIEIDKAIRDLEHRIVEELRLCITSQTPGAMLGGLEKEVLHIGRRLDELNDRVAQLRASSERESHHNNAPQTVRDIDSLEDIIVELAVRIDSTLAYDAALTDFVEAGGRAEIPNSRHQEPARSAGSARTVASFEGTAQEIYFAQSTSRKNLSQSTRVQREEADLTLDGANLLSIEQWPRELSAKIDAFGRPAAEQKHEDVGVAIGEMHGVATEDDERGTLPGIRDLPPATGIEPSVAHGGVKWKVSGRHGLAFRQWVPPSLLDEARWTMRRCVAELDSARGRRVAEGELTMSRLGKESFPGRFEAQLEFSNLSPLKRSFVLGIAGTILVLGGYFLSQPGFTSSNLVSPSGMEKSFESASVHGEAKSQAEKSASSLGVALAYGSPAASANLWGEELRRLTTPANEPRNLSARQPNFAGGILSDQDALTASSNYRPPRLPSDPSPEAKMSADELQAVAEHGDARAQYELATGLLSGHEPGRDANVAVRWLEKAAKQGFALAQLRLGILYGRGVGVSRDYALAHRWFQAAAENGNALAMHNLAVLLSEGHGRKPDHTSAAVWFRKAAELGIRDSQYNLGIDYMRSLGVERDLVQSYAWFAAAAAQGDAEARKKRKEVRELLDPEELDAAKALADRLIQKQPQTEASD